MKKIITLILVNEENEVYTTAQATTIAKYIKNNRLKVKQNIELTIDKINNKQNVIDIFKEYNNNTTLIISDLDILGRTIPSIIELLEMLLSMKIDIIIINQNLDLVHGDDPITKIILGVFNISIDLEKKLMSIRTKEALANKKNSGSTLGKPKGTIQKSKFDKDINNIEELLKLGLSVRKIAKQLGLNNHIGLNNYITKRGIKNKILNK